MLVFALAIILIAAIGLAVAAIVLVGMGGAFREANPELADKLAVAARHMNGDAEPPQFLVDFVTEQREAARGGRPVSGRIGEVRSAIVARRAAAQDPVDGVEPAGEDAALPARAAELAPAQA